MFKKALKSGLALLLLASVQQAAQAQAAGNINYESESKHRSKGNSNYTPEPQVAPKNLPTRLQWRGNQTYALHIKGLSNQAPDALVAMFAITQAGETAEETERFLRERYEKFQSALQGLGIAKENIYLDMVSFVPVYEYEVEKKVFSKTYNEVPKGFEMQQNVHIQFKDPNQIGKLVQAAAQSEIYDLVKVDYYVENIEKVYLELEKKCLEQGLALTKQFEIAGIKLDTFHRMIVDTRQSVYPITRYSSYQAFSSASVDNVKRTKVQTARKPNTYYYDKLSYDDFDVVINPLVHQPVVQFVYEMEIQFSVPPPKPAEPKTQRELYLLTPQGDLKRLPNP